jgi:hypothetical protein
MLDKTIQSQYLILFVACHYFLISCLCLTKIQCLLRSTRILKWKVITSFTNKDIIENKSIYMAYSLQVPKMHKSRRKKKWTSTCHQIVYEITHYWTKYTMNWYAESHLVMFIYGIIRKCPLLFKTWLNSLIH